MEHHAGEHPGLAAAQRGRVDAGAFHRLPGGLQQQPLLRVRGQGLARGDAEELGVELARVVQEPTAPDVGGARVVRVGVEQRLQVPTPVGGELGQRVPTGGQQVPQLVR